MNTEKDRQGTEAQRDEGTKCKAAPIPRVPIPSGSGVVATITVLLLMTGQALAQPCGGYEVTAIIQTPVDCGFGFDITTGLGLNDDGAVVGFYWCSGWEHEEAFVWTADEGFVTLERPQGVLSARAVDINDEGIICGTVVVSGLGNRGFVYGYEGDQFTILDVPPGGNWSQTRAINGKGEIVGFWGDIVKGPSPLAFVWRDGEMINIHPDFGTVKSDANGINASGLVTGWMGSSVATDAHAFIWDNGRVTEVPPIPGGVTSKGNRINTRRQLAISGKFNDDHPRGFISGGFLWDKGRWTDLGMLPGYDSMALKGLNDAGDIVGWSRAIESSNEPDVGFVWRDGVMKNLNNLIAPAAELEISRAEGINESGQITGQATSPDGLVAFVLTPIEPRLGDLDGDCQVGVADLLILLGNWGSCDKCAACPADLDNNCVVNVKDLLTLLGNWG